MPTCFVMQPFDGDKFDRRYEEVFKPAIIAAGLEPYRVDHDPTASIPIEQIESGIRDAQICLAEITLDNPNVWFELGYAIACKKQVVLVCSDERESPKFPFDVQHRAIIKYPTKSPSDYAALASRITEKLTAYMAKAENLAAVSETSRLTEVAGLDHIEVVALSTVGQNLDHSEDFVPVAQIRRDMEAGGFTKIAASLALRSLEDQGLVHGDWQNGYDDRFYAFSLTEHGWRWLVTNKDKFVLEAKSKPPRRLHLRQVDRDDIPF